MRIFISCVICLVFVFSSLAQTTKQTIIENGKSQYTIVIASHADTNETKAAHALQTYLQKVSGAMLKVVELHDGDKTKYLRKIFIGQSCPEYQTLSHHAYSIKTNEYGLQICGNTTYKTLESVYVFLEDFIGCKFLAPQVEFIPRKKSIQLSVDYVYDPKVETRTVHSKLFYDNPEFAAKRRVTTSGFPGFVQEAKVHSFHRFMPEKTFFASHPEYYALVRGRRLPTQLCLSNDTVYHIIRDSVEALFKRFPECGVISVSQDDNTQYCTCDRCAAFDAAEGSPSGTMIRLVNRVAKAFPDKTISTLAYQYTRHAPKHLRPEKNVLITLCSIEADRSAPIAEKSKDFENDLKEWSSVGATLQIWDYTTQFTNFLAPFPNIETLKPNINLFVNNNAKWIFEQHSHNPSELFELRSWLMSKLLWNPSLDYQTVLTEFTDAYYGKSGSLVKEYINDLHRSIQSYPKFYLFLYGDPSQGFDTWLNEEKLKKYNTLFDEASATYAYDTTMQQRINAARIGVDFATLEYYRLNRPGYPMTDIQGLNTRINRFEKAAKHSNVKIINEMGLPLDDYLHAYNTFIQTSSSENLAKGSKVTLKYKPTKYAREDPQTLTDGAFGGWSFYANWLGFLDHMDATIDLGEEKSFSQISINFLQVTNHVVFYPLDVSFEISHDGINFEKVSVAENKYPLTKESKINEIQNFASAKKDMKARFVRVIGNNMKSPPYWHHAAGTGAWIFADEIVVEK